MFFTILDDAANAVDTFTDERDAIASVGVRVVLATARLIHLELERRHKAAGNTHLCPRPRRSALHATNAGQPQHRRGAHGGAYEM